MKLVVNFTNILHAAFLLISLCQAYFVSAEKLRKTLLYKKAARKILVKLTHSTSSFYARRPQKRNKAA